MVSLAGSVLTKRNAWAEAGVEARAANCSGPDLLTLRRPCATVFRFVVMGGFLLLSACAKAPAPEIRAALPAQRNIPTPAPDPCAAPNTGQSDGRDIVSVSSPLLRPSDKGCPDYTRGLPSVLGGWTSPAPRRQEPQTQNPGANARRNDVLNERLWLRAHRRRDTDIRVPH